MAAVNLPAFRISQAAVGRRLASVLLRVRAGELSEADFLDTISAVLDSCVSEDFTPDPDAGIDAEILADEQAEIEKSVRRSAAARKAAERRRLQREGCRPMKGAAEVHSDDNEIAAVKAVIPAAVPRSRKKDRGLKRRLRKAGGDSGL